MDMGMFKVGIDMVNPTHIVGFAIGACRASPADKQLRAA